MTGWLTSTPGRTASRRPRQPPSASLQLDAPASLEWNGASRLQARLREDAAADGAVVGVAVARGCGSVDVRIVGPAAGLTLRFDQAEACPNAVRFAVRAAIAQYRSALGLEARDSDQE